MVHISFYEIIQINMLGAWFYSLSTMAGLATLFVFNLTSNWRARKIGFSSLVFGAVIGSISPIQPTGMYGIAFESYSQLFLFQAIGIVLASLLILTLISIKYIKREDPRSAIYTVIKSILSPITLGLIMLWISICLLFRQGGRFYLMLFGYGTIRDSWFDRNIILWAFFMAGLFFLLIGLFLERKKHEIRKYPMPEHKIREIKGTSKLERIARFFRKID